MISPNKTEFIMTHHDLSNLYIVLCQLWKSPGICSRGHILGKSYSPVGQKWLRGIAAVVTQLLKIFHNIEWKIFKILRKCEKLCKLSMKYEENILIYFSFL